MKNLSFAVFALYSFALFFLSCSKEPVLSPIETSESLREWYIFNSTNYKQENIIWSKAKLMKLKDSSNAFAFPVITNAGIKELIIFERNGKREAVFKQYTFRGDNHEMRGFSINGELLKVLTVQKNQKIIPQKSKLLIGRFLNSELPLDDPNYIWDQGMAFSFYFIYYGGGTTYYVSNTGQGSSYFNTIYNDYLLGGGGGNFDSYYAYNKYNFSQIDDKLTNPCFISVLNELRNNNIYGEMSDVIESLDQSKNGQKYKFDIREMSLLEEQKYSADNAIVNFKNEICLNTNKFKNTSKEYIARVILHEFLHLHINKSNYLDHTEIATKYIKPMADFLHKLYDTNYEDALALSLSGLQKIPNYSTLLKYYKKNTTTIYEVKLKYTTNGYGKYCN